MSTTTAMAIGQSISTEAGRYTITLRRQETVYRVETRSGSFAGPLVDELTGSFATEQVARLAARTVTKAFRDGMCATDVADELRATLQSEIADQYNRRHRNHGYLHDLERAYDWFTPACEMDRFNQMAAEMYDADVAGVRTLNEIREERAAEAARNFQEVDMATNDNTSISDAEMQSLLDFATQVGNIVAAGVRDETRAKTFADLKRLHAEGMKRDREQVA